MAVSHAQTRTGGRSATTGTIVGDIALSVGMPDLAAPEGWHWTKLTDVARLETGHTPSRKHPEYWGGGIPWIGIKDATGNHGKTIYDTIQHTNELGIANSSARILPENTICLSRTASVGHVVVMGRPMATSQDFVNWVCSENLDSRFLKYVLLGERNAFLRFASGTTHQTIYFPEVKAFHVCLPPPYRTTRHCPHSWRAGRQDRAEPAYERDAGGDGPRPVQVLVRRLRPRPRQDRGPRPRPAQTPRRPLPRPPRRLRDRQNPGGVAAPNASRHLISESRKLEIKRSSREYPIR